MEYQLKIILFLKVMNISEDEFFSGVGREFVKFVESYNFTKLTKYEIKVSHL